MERSTVLLYLILSIVLTALIVWYTITWCYKNAENDRKKLNEITNANDNNTNNEFNL